MTTALNPIGIGTTPGDGTGDEPRAGFTKVKSDHANFLAAITRRATAPGTFGTTSSAGSTTVLNDSTQSWATNQFSGQTVTILTGTLAGYSGTVSSNTATSITLSSALGSAIGSGVGYQVTPAVTNAGSDGFATAAGGTAPSTIVDANQAWTANAWAGYWVTMLSGAFAGQSAPIASNTATTLTLAAPFTAAVAAGSAYAIGSAPKYVPGSLGAALNYAPSAGSVDPGTGITGFVSVAGSAGTGRLKITLSGNTTFAGLPAGADGQELIGMVVAGAYSLTLTHLGTTGGAQIQASADEAYALYDNFRLVYDGGLSKWVLIA